MVVYQIWFGIAIYYLDFKQTANKHSTNDKQAMKSIVFYQYQTNRNVIVFMFDKQTFASIMSMLHNPFDLYFIDSLHVSLFVCFIIHFAIEQPFHSWNLFHSWSSFHSLGSFFAKLVRKFFSERFRIFNYHFLF